MTSKIARLRITSILETISFIVLLVMMFTGNEAGVSVVGATHGFLFLAYAIFVWFDHEDLGWTTGFAVLSIITGPLGAILVLERLRRDGVERSTT
jgi:integral membrane protein